MEKLDENILFEIGKLTKQIRKEVSKIPKINTDIKEIINFVEKSIFEKGFLPAFPCTVSVNDVAAHYTIFDEGYLLKKGDVIKIDFGISNNGFITDNAFTLEIEDNKHEKIMKANFEGLNAILENIKIGMKLTEIGKIVNDIALSNNFNTIHNLSGHQIGRNDLHCGLSIPNYENGDNRIIENNTEFAIEPFFTYGNPKVKSSGPSNILHLNNFKPVRDPIAKKVLNFIVEKYPILPFSKRWLLKEIREELNLKGIGFEKKKLLYAIKILKLNKIIYEYDTLSTVDNSIVTQYEDTIIFTENNKKIITRLN